LNQIIRDDAKTIANADLPWEELNGKTVLISGANGYVPAYFVHAFMVRNDLYGENIRVIALCRSEERAKERFAEYLNRGDFALRIQDVCSPMDDVVEPIHYLIHAASPAGVRNSNIDPVATFNAIVMGCSNMLGLCVRSRAEGFLFLSSIDIYGKSCAAERFSETSHGVLDPMNPRNVYACGKRAAETLCASYHAHHGAPVVVARPSQICGPGIALNDGRLHADFISQMLGGDVIVLKGDGSAKRTFIYIADAVTGMLTALLKGTQGEAYNIVNENGEATVLELAELMASLVSNRKIEIVFDYGKRGTPEVVYAASCVTGSSEKLWALGWRPQLALRDLCRRTMGYYGLRTEGWK
jgi:nucleoside-diphosphate-sugar epimerase